MGEKEEKVLSIIIPAYNAMPHLSVALDSILDQSYPLEGVEVIVVDDGSTDDTLLAAEKYQALYPDLFSVIALPEASGTPAKPRNVALDQAKGRYVFFLDADDWLAPRAVELMIDHAEEWESDVLLVKLVGEGGRDVPQSMFFANQPSVDVFASNVMWTFGPMKLFRRNLLVQNHIYFPSYMPEDISFTLKAYLAAETVSVASDYGYYHYLLYDTDQQCSFSTWENLESNYRAMVDAFTIVSTLMFQENDPIILLRRLFQRDISNMLISACRQNDKGMFEKICNLVRPFYSDRVSSSMALPQRIILDCSLIKGFEPASKAAVWIQNGELDEKCFRCIDGRLAFCSAFNGFHLSVPLSDMGGAGAQVNSVELQPDGCSLLVKGTISAPYWILTENRNLALQIQEVRGHPTIELNCPIIECGVADEETKKGCREWVCSLSESHLAKLPLFSFPLRRRDFSGEKKWYVYLLIKSNGKLIKRVRVTTDWRFAESVNTPLCSLTSDWCCTVSAYQTQRGGLCLITTKHKIFRI